ncbi:MAG TPA: hypothetical protein PKX93_06755 [bacterium]|nr:hypothetical protein [bacterium]HOL67137.1 hypothetical protein [bacterium]HPP12304.1 hypothetical protein [bacterium]
MEINLSAMLLNPRYPERFKEQYLNYLVWLKEQGVVFTLGSDGHGSYQLNPQRAAAWLNSFGFQEDDFWYPGKD